jgi:hypothetical protein
VVAEAATGIRAMELAAVMPNTSRIFQASRLTDGDYTQTGPLAPNAQQVDHAGRVLVLVDHFHPVCLGDNRGPNLPRGRQSP